MPDADLLSDRATRRREFRGWVIANFMDHAGRSSGQRPSRFDRNPTKRRGLLDFPFPNREMPTESTNRLAPA